MFKRSHKIKIIMLLCAVFCGAGYLKANAQDNDYTASAMETEDDLKYDPSDYQQWKDNFKETPVEDMLFRDNKEGCANKMAFSMILIKKYKSGEGIDDIARSPILGPYMEEQYALIQEKGLAQAQKDIMMDYQKCIKDAKIEEDEGDEYDLNMQFGACNKLNKILMGTIDSIKKRQSIETVFKRYERKYPDLSETGYGDIDDPVPLFIGQLYKKAQEERSNNNTSNYDSLYELASQLVVACTM